MKVAELNETIYTVEREIDCLGSLLKDEQARTMAGVCDDDLDCILQQYNDLQSHVRDLIAQMKLAQQRKQPVELMGLGI